MLEISSATGVGHLLNGSGRPSEHDQDDLDHVEVTRRDEMRHDELCVRYPDVEQQRDRIALFESLVEQIAQRFEVQVTSSSSSFSILMMSPSKANNADLVPAITALRSETPPPTSSKRRSSAINSVNSACAGLAIKQSTRPGRLLICVWAALLMGELS